ncbi:hypothetical protein ACQKKK_22570 [Peribacillus sp. NPDC006672]|uniref:hypothetical protein n=1 Tax=Peribacillus sp. NPDC006672 TaxID=3390606 RepID=UPI003CFD1FA9
MKLEYSLDWLGGEMTLWILAAINVNCFIRREIHPRDQKQDAQGNQKIRKASNKQKKLDHIYLKKNMEVYIIL